MQKKYLILSKNKDKYLIVAPLGSQTDVFVYANSDEELFHEMVYDYTKLDLQKMETGTYKIFIPSCHLGVSFSLILKD